MRSIIHKSCVAALVMCALAIPGTNALAAGSMHIAFGDVPGPDMLNFLIAAKQAEARGVTLKISYMHDEETAAQAIVSGQADIGVGTPYALIQKVKAPIRMFFQLSALRFFPIVNKEKYQSWKDLDGVDMYTHARGSGTEAIMNLMAMKNGIKYASMSYVPGSAVRAGAMLQGRIDATIVDSSRRRLLMEKGEGKFMMLPMPDIKASDEALYANTEFLQDKSGAIDILLEELLVVWREVNKDPTYIVRQRDKYNLMPDMPAKEVEEILPYYEESVENTMFSNNGGGVAAVKGDFEFYGFAGTIKGDPMSHKVEDYWYMAPLDKALKKVGMM